MGMVITIKNVANGSTVRMEVEYTDRVGEVIEPLRSIGRRMREHTYSEKEDHCCHRQ